MCVCVCVCVCESVCVCVLVRNTQLRGALTTLCEGLMDIMLVCMAQPNGHMPPWPLAALPVPQWLSVLVAREVPSHSLHAVA